jgi:hypothetical protein
MIVDLAILHHHRFFISTRVRILRSIYFFDFLRLVQVPDLIVLISLVSSWWRSFNLVRGNRCKRDSEEIINFFEKIFKISQSKKSTKG